MELEKMSKYARKKALQAQQAAEDAKAERKASALAAAFEAVKRQKEPPKPKAVKPKPPEPQPRGLINDLGNRPEQVSILLSKAADNMAEALSIMTEILAMSAKGVQQAEPRAITSFLAVATGRMKGMATRASLIPNKRQEQKGGAE